MIYKIEHCVDPRHPAYVSSDYAPDDMELLVAYVTNQFLVIAPDLGLTPRQIADIMRDVYGCMILEPRRGRRVTVLDAYAIEARFSPERALIRDLEKFRRDGLTGVLTKAAREIEAGDGAAAWFMLRVASGGHGTILGDDPYGTGFEYCYCKAGFTWGQAICVPDVEPDPGYELDGWFAENGTRLEDSTVILATQLVTVRFRSCVPDPRSDAGRD